jgi:glycosyltransferase involved in cell wall biosynthesis
MKNQTNKIRIGYILKMFPRFSETFIMNEILELERQGAEVTIFSILPPIDGKFHPRLSGINAQVHYVPPHRYSEFWKMLRNSNGFFKSRKKGYAKALQHALECSKDSALKYLIRAGYIADMSRSLNLDLFHSHFASSPTHVAMYTSMMTGVPFSFIAHAKDIYLNNLDRKLLRDLIKYSSLTVTVSDANKEHLKKIAGNHNNGKLVRIYNGLDLDYFKNHSNDRIPNQILSVGRLVEKKGFHILVKAMRILKDRGRNIQCEIIGEGKERAALESRIAKHNLKRTVKLLGPLPQDEVVRKMKQAAVFVLPAIVAEDGNRDALPTVLLEAMAVGLPVISTELVGIPEILDNGKCGILVAQRDPTALADSIEKLMDNQKLKDRFTQAGIRKVKKDFNVKKNVRELHNRMINSVYN